MKKNVLMRVSTLLSVIGLCVASSAPSLADGSYGPHTEDFRFIFPLDGISWYPVEDMVANCRGTYDDAKATITYEQVHGTTYVIIKVKNTVPNTFWTIWLRTDAGSTSPLAGLAITALANPDDTADLAKVTPDTSLTQEAMNLGLVGDDGTGSPHVANGFWTDSWGYGEFFAKLDYPLVKGAFQWQEYDSSLARSAIGTSPFQLRIASHCDDQVGHGLVPGFHEMWFDWN